jgi:predicted AAA+ superfamily ATPase
MDYQLAFAEIMAEARDEARSPYLRRHLSYRVLPHKAVVLKGIRRSGKSTLLRQIEDDERAAGRSCLYVNFIDERLMGLAASELGGMFDAFHRVFPQVKSSQGVTLLCDELQVVDGWEAFVERQLRIRGRRVFITGSSAKLLSTEIASAMRGRSLSYEVFPFDFREYLALKGSLPANVSLGAEAKAAVKAQFHDYLMEGGFPETIGVDRRTQVQILQEYLDVLLLRDVIERHDAASPVLLKRFMLQLMSRFASGFTINKFVELLRAQGLGTAKSHVSDMLEWLTDAYAVFTVTIFSESVQKQNTNPKKVYVVDNGMINAVTTGRLKNEGRLLENLVFMLLRRAGAHVSYYKTRSGYEVDFYASDRGLIQVAWSLDDEATRLRELRALHEAMAELQVETSLLLTADTSEEVRLESGLVRIVPAWEWALSGASA